MRARVALIAGVLIALLSAVPAQAEEPENLVWCLIHWSHC